MKVRILLCGCCFFLCVGAFPQDRQERVLADSLFIQAGKFREAGAIYQQLARQWEQAGNLDSAFRHDLLFAKTLEQAQDYQVCLQVCERLVIDPWRPHAGRYLGDVYAVKGYAELSLFALEEAISSFDMAIKIEASLARPDTLRLAESQQFLGLALMYADRDEEAERQLLQAYQKFVEHLPEHDIKLGYVANSLYLFYNERYAFGKARKFLQRAMQILQQQLPPTHPHLAVLLNNMAVLYESSGHPQESHDIHLQLIPMNLEAGRHRMLSENYFNLAQLLMKMKDVELAGSYYQQSLELADPLYPNPGFERANLYDGLGHYSFATKAYAQADSFFSLALAQKQAVSLPMQKEIARSYHNLALVASEQKNWELAMDLLSKSMRIRKQELGDQHPMTLESQYRLGKVNWELGKQHEALILWKNCLDGFWLRQGSGYHHVADMAYWIAEAYQQMHQPDSVERYLRLAWTSMLNQQKVLSDWTQIDQSPIQMLRPEVFAICRFHLDFLLHHPSMSPAQKIHLTQAIIHQFNDFLPKILPLLSSHQAQASLSKTLRRIYATAALVLHRATDGDVEAYHPLMLACIENSKAFSISLALQRQEAMTYAHVPDTIQEKERYLRARIWAIQALKENPKQEVRRQVLQQEIEVQADWQALRQEIAVQHPDYFQLLYQKPPLDVMQIRQTLEEEETSMLAYFDQDSILLAVVQHAGTMHSYELRPEAFWRDSLQHFNHLVGSRGNMKRIAELSHFLYQQLIAPFHEALGKRVQLLPDGALYVLNFELLLTRPVGQLTDLAALPWLIHKHQISYANLLGTSDVSLSSHTDYLAIAPGFSPSLKHAYQNELSPGEQVDSVFLQWLSTPWSLELVQQFSRENWGKTLLESEATKVHVLQQAKTARLIHFATHASVNDTAPLQSFLALHPAAGQADAGYLFAYELYGMDLQTSLVVLSACQTGLGAYQEGEGILSLAHAFQYAGSPSLIMSLWSIDDQQTNRLIRNFYQKTEQKLPVMQALHQSKLAYLAQYSGDLAHPYYWGSLVFLGENHVISPPFWKRNSFFYFIGFLAVMGLAVIFFQKSRKKMMTSTLFTP